MPSLRDATPRDMAAMMASTRTATYEVFSCLKEDRPIPDWCRGAIGEMKDAEWIGEEDGELHITMRGHDHLASF